MGDVSEAHSEVVEHLVPLPAGPRFDPADPVEQVVEDAVPIGPGERFERGEDPPFTDVRRSSVDVPGKAAEVFVERDQHQFAGETFGPALLVGRERNRVRRKEFSVLHQVFRAVVLARSQIAKGAVAGRATLVSSHEPMLPAAGAPAFKPTSLPAGRKNRESPRAKKRGDGLERRPPASSPGGGRHRARARNPGR